MIALLCCCLMRFWIRSIEVSMSDTGIEKIEIEANQVPTIIQEQWEKLKLAEKKVSESFQMAERAQDSALNAKKKSAGILNRKAAIESLQSATVNLADAQMSTATSQKVLFEYQQTVDEVIKYIFSLGISNIAVTRSVIKELELRLSNASTEEIDEFAKNEILNVIKELKAQEDYMKKQNDLSTKVREHDIAFENFEKRESEQDDLLKTHTEKDKEHDRLLAETKNINIVQDEEIKRQADKDAEHDRRLNDRDKAIENYINKVHALENQFISLQNQLNRQSEELDKLISKTNNRCKNTNNQMLIIIALIVAVISLVLSIIRLWI